MSATPKPGPWAPLELHIGSRSFWVVVSPDGKLAETEGNARLQAAAPELLSALQSLRSFVAIMVGRGPDAVIPDTITTPIGVPVKIGEIMRDAEAALARAEGRT